MDFFLTYWEGDAVMTVMTFLYTRQLLAKKDEGCVWDQTFTRNNAYKIKVQPNSHAAVSCSRQYALQWELNFYIIRQDLFLLNPKILIPTCFPVEMAGVIWGNLTNRVRRAPPSPPITAALNRLGPRGPMNNSHSNLHILKSK